ncbi:MAG: hypothetical protein ABL911_12340 [Gallionella sp.]
MNEDAYVLPPHFVLFQQHLHKHHLNLQSALHSTEIGHRNVHLTPTYLSEQLGYLVEGVDDITRVVKNTLGNLLSPLGVSKIKVDAYMAIFGKKLNSLLLHYEQLRANLVTPSQQYGQTLLIEMYSNVLVELHNWMMDMLTFFADPVTWAKQRGLPTTGHVEISFTLTFTPPPQANELVLWAQNQPGWSATAAPFRAAPQCASRGLFGNLLLAWMGYELIENLLGDDEV